MAVTRRDLLHLDNALAELEHLLATPAFALWVVDTRDILAAAVIAMRERGLIPEATAQVYADYESARLTLSRAHARRDATTGHPVEDGQGVFVIADHVAFEAALTDLRLDDRWRDAYRDVAGQKQQWNRWMDEPAEADVVTRIPRLAVTDLPKTVTPGLVKPLRPFLIRVLQD